MRLEHLEMCAHCVYKNRFVRSYEVEKEDLSVKKMRLWFVFECEALKLVQWFVAKIDDFNGILLFVFFSEIKRYFAKKSIQWF